MVNESESLINVVIGNKPKMLTGLDQNGKWTSLEVTISSNEDVVPPAKRRHLTYSGIYAERGKPVISSFEESKSQDEPIGLRVWDNRKSEWLCCNGRDTS